MEAFTHEQFITAMRMQGRDVAVTPETIKKSELAKDLRLNEVKLRWAKVQEEEDMRRERQLREIRKNAQRQIRSETEQRFAVGAKTLERNTECPKVVEPRDLDESKADVTQQPPLEPVHEESILLESTPSTMIPQTIEDVRREVVVQKRDAPHSLQSPSVCVDMWWRGCIDLDLSCVTLNNNGRCNGFFFFGEDSAGNAFDHSGDMLSAPSPSGARETIRVSVEKLQPDVAFVYFVMTAFSAEDLQHVEELLVRIYDSTNSTICVADLSQVANKRAVVLCRLRRQCTSHAIEVMENLTFDHGDTVRSLSKEIESHAAKSL